MQSFTKQAYRQFIAEHCSCPNFIGYSEMVCWIGMLTCLLYVRVLTFELKVALCEIWESRIKVKLRVS